VSTDAYLDAKAAFERIDASVTDLAARLVKVGEAIRTNRGRFCFSNTPGAGFPAEVAMGGLSQDGNTWPSAATINAALADWHKAKQAMDMAWAAIPQDRRAGLVPPVR
jgi:hypothetical protein